MADTNICGVTGTQDHSPECKYLGNDMWDCGKLDNQHDYDYSDAHMNDVRFGGTLDETGE